MPTTTTLFKTLHINDHEMWLLKAIKQLRQTVTVVSVAVVTVGVVIHDLITNFLVIKYYPSLTTEQ